MNNHKPNFFIVGFPKSGTTSMYCYLNQHPDIFMSAIKEPNYFCTDKIEEAKEFHENKLPFKAYNKSEYLKLFRSKKQFAAVGEASVNYILSEVAATNISQFNPSAKIIIMIREPVSLLHSLHNHMLFTERENIKDFEKALEAEDYRRKWHKLPSNIIWPSRYFYSEYIQFSKHIQQFTKLFDESNVKIILFDDFKENTEKIYRETLEFLKVDSSFNANLNIINQSKREIFKLPFKKQITSLITRKFSPKVKNFLSDTYLKINTRNHKKKPLNKNLINELKTQFKPEVKKLGKLLKRDLLKLWQY